MTNWNNDNKILLDIDKMFEDVFEEDSEPAKPCIQIQSGEVLNRAAALLMLPLEKTIDGVVYTLVEIYRKEGQTKYDAKYVAPGELND